MKKIKQFLIIAFVGILISSCSQKPIYTDKELEINEISTKDDISALVDQGINIIDVQLSQNNVMPKKELIVFVRIDNSQQIDNLDDYLIEIFEKIYNQFLTGSIFQFSKLTVIYDDIGEISIDERTLQNINFEDSNIVEYITYY